MGPDVVAERVRSISLVRSDPDASPERIRAALRATAQVRSWLAASEADLTRALTTHVSFPEKDIADCTRGTQREAMATTDRSKTLESLPSIAEALGNGAVTTGHVDAITKIGKGLDDDQRDELFGRVEQLAGVAATTTVDEFRRRLAIEAKHIRRGDGVDRLERQRRAVRLRTWTDGEGMLCLAGRFDPVAGARLVSRLDAATTAIFAERTPATCPVDPLERRQHLQGLALVQVVTGGAPAGRPGRPEYVVVIDSSQPVGGGEPTVDWGLPVEVPYRVVADLSADGVVHPVVVRNGVVIHAPGTLDLGRATRLASPAQRRALRALYATCAIPGCPVRFDRCRLHHVVWWRNGGRTDLANLLPVCAHHHGKIHDAGWVLTLGPDRRLTIRFPDGSVHNTGPPSRRAA